MEARVADMVQVEAARIPDRDRLLVALNESGLNARAVDEVGIEVPCGGDSNALCDDLLSHVEDLVISIGAPFVPVKHEGVIYIRPPVS
jgi:hypothetical protein